MKKTNNGNGDAHVHNLISHGTTIKGDIETNKDAKEDSEKLNFQLYKFIENYDERHTHNEKVNIEQIKS